MALSLSNTYTPLTITTKPRRSDPATLTSSTAFRPVGPGRRGCKLIKRVNPVRAAVSGANEARSSVVEKDSERKLSDCWREIMGRDDWAGLMDPMDPLLRNELIRYGEMAQACYDAFDYDPYSKYSGSCRFKANEFFDELDMAQAGYKITRYLYATSNVNLPNFFTKTRYPKLWSKYANWIGFIAVSDDEMTKKLGRRDVCVTWRGTVTRLEWVHDMMILLRPISSDKVPSPDPSVRVESGFLDLYTDKDENCKFCKYSVREQVLAEVNRLVHHAYPTEQMSITITGHSLGGALALLNAYDIVETGIHERKNGMTMPVTALTFAAPRVGNARFKARLEFLGLKVMRVVNVHDVVPQGPGWFTNERHPVLMKMSENLPFSYSHVGVELALDHTKSTFLRPDGDKNCAHNLEAYLHLLDGYHGTGERFVLANGRDYALVNKACDFLKDEHQIPPNWRQDQNKRMVKNPDKRWVQQERDILDDHPCEMDHHIKLLKDRL